MSGLEVVVRPVVFPNIRPAPARALAPEDNPDQGIATLSGSGGRLIDLPHSFSDSVSRQKQQIQTRAVVDVQRVYQVEENGDINHDNYVDVNRTTKARFETPGDNPFKVLYGVPTPDDVNVVTIDYGKVINYRSAEKQAIAAPEP